MEKKLNNLNSVLNDEMSTDLVFTAKDEAAVLRKIEELRYAKIKPKRKSYAPQVLTAAVVAGIAFAGYEVMNYENAPNSAEKKEVKEQFAAPNEQFSEPKGTVTYDPDTKTLDVKGSVVNSSKHDGVPFEMKLVLKNEALTDAAGETEVVVDVPDGEMRAGDPFTFASSIPLDERLERSSLENGIEVVFYNEERVLYSYMINDVAVNEATKPAAERLIVQSTELKAGESKQLDVLVTFEKNGAEETLSVMNDPNYSKHVTFEVRDENVVTINENGVIQATENPSADQTVIVVSYEDEFGTTLVQEVAVTIEKWDLETMSWEELKNVLKTDMTMEQVEELFGTNYSTGIDAMYGNPYWEFKFGESEGYKYNPPPNSVDAIDVEGLKDEKVQKIIVILWERNNKVRSYSMYTSENGEVIRKRQLKPGDTE